MTSAFQPSQYLHSHGVDLAVYTQGNRRKPAIILIHGYPDNHSVWKSIADKLSEDFFVVSYDVRGAGASTAPGRIRDYSLELLSEDLQTVMDFASPNRPVHLVGHDWGAIQTWESVTAPHLQARIASYTAISGPCLDHVGHLLRDYLREHSAASLAKLGNQVLHSWYIFLFQAPLLAPMIWRAGLGTSWPRLLERREGVREPEPNPTQAADGENGIALYRRNIFPRLLQPRDRYSRVRTQIIQPRADNYVRPQVYDNVERWVPNLIRREVDGGHWLLLSQPEQMAGWIRAFIQAEK